MAANILIVDDDPNFCASFSDVLKEKGHNVDAALSGQEALDKLRSAEYRIVFVDMKMPGLDGVETVTEIKKIKPDVTVVGITGYDDYELVKKAVESGAQGCIYKPVDYELINKIIEKSI